MIKYFCVGENFGGSETKRRAWYILRPCKFLAWLSSVSEAWRAELISEL